MRDKQELKGLIHIWQLELNKIISGWHLLHGAHDEFDALIQKLIGHLTRGADKDKIHDLLESELIVRYGLDPTTGDLDKFAHEINDWWIDSRSKDHLQNFAL